MWPLLPCSDGRPEMTHWCGSARRREGGRHVERGVDRVEDACKTHTRKVEAEGLARVVCHPELQSELQATLDYNVEAISKQTNKTERRDVAER